MTGADICNCLISTDTDCTSSLDNLCLRCPRDALALEMASLYLGVWWVRGSEQNLWGVFGIAVTTSQLVALSGRSCLCVRCPTQINFKLNLFCVMLTLK